MLRELSERVKDSQISLTSLSLPELGELYEANKRFFKKHVLDDGQYLTVVLVRKLQMYLVACV